MTPSRRTLKLPRLDANPILVKELRSRMRGMRAFAILTGVLLLLAGVSYLFYRIVLATTMYSNMPVSPQIGQSLLVGLALVELMMVCFIAPAVTAGAISGEKERLTYEMLLATPLRPARILWGKLISALGYVFLLILAGVPMFSLVFTFGGVTVLDMVKVLIFLTATAVTLGVIGMTLSAWLERTVRATVFSYLVVLGLLIGPLGIYITVGVIRQNLPPPWILIPNPVSALFSTLPLASGGGSPIGVVGELGRVLAGGMAIDEGMLKGVTRPLYHYTLALYATLSLGLYLLATRLVRPTRRWRIRWREVGITLGLFLALAVAVVTPFVATADRYQEGMLRPEPTPDPFTVEGPVPPVVMEVERAVPVKVIPAVPPTPAPTPPTNSALSTGKASAADLAGLYATVIRHLYVADHGQPEAPRLETLTVGRTADDSAVLGVPNGSQPIAIPLEVQAGVVEALSDLGPEIEWVDGQATFTLGDAYLNEDGTAQVSLLFRPTPDISIARTYLLERVEGLWSIVKEI